MYSILLVEDEPLELETLRDYVNWEKVGISQVYTARGGKSALACFAQHEPDIMITDIQMPGMSGIELASAVREEGYQCKIVFLTGYDEFEYAKSALKLGAEDYILKPFLPEEIENLMQKLIGKIRREKRTEESIKIAYGKLLEQMCRAETAEQQKKLAEEMEGYEPDLSRGKAFRMFGIYGAGRDSLQELQHFPELVYALEGGMDLCIGIVRSYLPLRDFCGRVRERILAPSFSLVYLAEKLGAEELGEGYRLLSGCADTLFYLEKGQIYDAGELPGERQRIRGEKSWGITEEEQGAFLKADEENVLLRAILRGNGKEAEENLLRYGNSLASLEAEQCKKRLFELLTALHYGLRKKDSLFCKKMEPEKAALEQAFWQKRFLAEILEELCGYVGKLCAHYQEKAENQDWYLVAWVKDYIESHYQGDLSVEEMAEEIGLSPNYLRSRFKAGAGETILEYLTEFRLEKACSLLRSPTIRVKEISGMVGYENTSYFTQIFRKRYGMTPGEYKKTF